MTQKGVTDIRFDLFGLFHAGLWLLASAGALMLAIASIRFSETWPVPTLAALSAACLWVGRFYLRSSVTAVRHSHLGWVGRGE